MKQYLLFFLLIASSFMGWAQLFKPGKITYYYPNQSLDGWIFSRNYYYTYNSNGDVITSLQTDADNIPTRKDSNVYNAAFQLTEKHTFITGQLIRDTKIINLYDDQGISTGSLVYRWKGLWELASGSETLRSYNATTHEETEITKTYSPSTEKWDYLIKKVTLFDDLQEKKSITLYSADAHQNFQLFSKQTFNGWHNFQKNIYKGQVTEKYINGAWKEESNSTVVKSGTLWVETDVRTDHAPGTYRILFAEDATFREVMKAYGVGWLSLSVFTKNDSIERILHNDFLGDMLKTVETNEKELDAHGSLIRTTLHIQNAMGVTTKFTEVINEISYDNRGLPLEDISLATNNIIVAHQPAQKIVYADYKDVKLTTQQDTIGPKIYHLNIYPNPGKGTFYISGYTEILFAEIYTSSGNLVRSIEINNNQMNLGDLPSGVYQVRLKHELGQQIEKLVIAP